MRQVAINECSVGLGHLRAVYGGIARLGCVGMFEIAKGGGSNVISAFYANFVSRVFNVC